MKIGSGHDVKTAQTITHRTTKHKYQRKMERLNKCYQNAAFPGFNTIKWCICIMALLIISSNMIPLELLSSSMLKTSEHLHSTATDEHNKFQSLNDLQNFVNNITHFNIDKSSNDTNEYYLLLSSHLNNHRIAPQYNIIVYSLKNQRNVLFHCNNDKGGLGNNLYNYWWSRALAFYFNLEYQFVINKKSYIYKLPNTSKYIKNILMQTMYGKHKYDKIWSDAMNTKTNNSVPKFVFLLPTYSSDTFMKYMMQQIRNNNMNLNDLLSEYNTVQLYLLTQLLSISKDNFSNNELLDNINSFRNDIGSHMFHSMHWPWGSKWRMFYLNDIFRKNVISPETYKVFSKYRHLLNLDKTEVYNKYDIVVHIRCGDIMSENTGFCGFHTFDFYRESLKHIMLMNNNFSDTNIKERNAYILLQLLDGEQIHDSTINIHSEKADDEKKCRIFADIVIPKMKEEIFDPYNYTTYFISNGSLHEDFYRLIMGPNIICSKSTFCTSASLVNINATDIIWPSKSVHNYPTQNIFEMKNKMVSSATIHKKNLTAQQIADYVITH